MQGSLMLAPDVPDTTLVLTSSVPDGFGEKSCSLTRARSELKAPEELSSALL